MAERKGQCMCGAVKFTAQSVPDTYGACHCEMCRRWTGAALVAATVPAKGITWTGVEKIRKVQSSDWAERAFCRTCGSHLYYHLKFHDHFALSAGLFQDAKITKLSQQIFIDEKPDFYELANDTPMLTGEEALAAFEAANTDDA